MSNTGVLIMAAGKGTRMKSAHPKVLHDVLDKKLIDYVIENALSYTQNVSVLVSSDEVSEYITNKYPIKILWQREQLGTGHAVKICCEWWSDFKNLIVLNGDVPLMKKSSLKNFIDSSLNYDCVITSFITENPGAYGRIVHESNNIKIVEFKDASDDEKKIKEVNAGCYAFKVKSLEQVINLIDNNNAQGEYYLPDVLKFMNQKNMRVNSFIMPELEMLGVNNQEELTNINLILRDEILKKHLSNGVNILDLNSVYIGSDVEIDPDVKIMPNVQIWGKSKILSGSVIGSGSILKNAVIGHDVNIIAYAVIENSELKNNSKAGPFIYIRENSCLEKNSFAGKFVELKNTIVGENSKVPHLSYMGDAVLGHNVNIGAGSITCNYDGKNKNKTHIGNNCFVGSDTMFIAPVEIGDDSATAAGSVITKDIPVNSLGVARERQININDWSKRKK